MKNLASHVFLCIICFLSVATLARGQSVPAQTGSPLYSGFEVPTLNGTLTYALSAGERLTFGYKAANGTVSAATLSGNVGFITPSKTKPTTITYTGGYLATTYGQPSTFFHDFSIAQEFNTKNVKLTASDNLRYLPETPASGIFGVVGTGTTVGTTTTQGVLIPFATRIQNTSIADATVLLTGKTALTGTGYYGIERFPGYTGGIQTDTYDIRGGVLHRFNSLQSLAVDYSYTHFSYVNITGQFEAQGVSATYKRQFTRKLLVSLGAGPQVISSYSLTHRPASASYTADVSATYVGSAAAGFAATGTFKRSANGGSGITFGAINDTLSGSVTRRLTRSLQFTALGTYSQSNGLQLITAIPIDTKTVVGSTQVNRAFTRTLSVFVSYTLQHQSIQGYSSTSINPLNGLQQILGFGLTYSPNAVRLGRQ